MSLCYGREHDTGQQIPCFDRCQLTWISNIKDNYTVRVSLEVSNQQKLPHTLSEFTS